ncbi:MAG TPA: hypothetical protein VFS15_25715, partial [Kofleriaceae bacterium]|nr:hypothetical protein [Kofleriaceae bacterium]
MTTEATPEFAPGVDEPPSEIDRREMMKLLAAGAALAGASSLAGCMKKPEERIMPRVENPPELTPGVPVSYATSMVIDGFATGLVVETQEARPTKVEGNPEHPASLGATSALHQASVLQLYDPHRATGALLQGAPTDLSATLHDLARRERMAGLWFLLHPQSSPLIEEQMARVRARHPTARFAFYSPVDRREVYEGARRVFGRPLECQYRFAQADVVVLLDADPLCAMPGSVRWSRDFAQRRRMNAATDQPSRIYAAEPRPTPSGSLADHRLPVRASEIRALALALLSALEQRSASELPAEQRAWVDAAAADLGASRGRALVVVGERQPAEVHALGHLINQALGAFGTTIALTRPALIDPLGLSLGDLVSALRAGSVQTLVIAEVNPLYAGPADLGLAELLPRVPELIYAGFAQDETSRRCQLFLPMTHYMESWGDARAYDGTISFVQPLIQPMYGGVSLLELLATFGGDPEANGHDLVLRRYQQGTS